MPGKCPPELKGKMDSCIAKVEAKGDVDNAYAVCYASIVEGHSAEEIREKFKIPDGVYEYFKVQETGIPEKMSASERIAVEGFMAQDFKHPFKIMPIGKFYRGERILDITPERAREIYSNWKQGLPRYGLSINVEHGNDKTQPGVIGRVKEIALRPDGIYAERVEFSKIGEDLLNEDRYRAISPEIIWSLNEGAKYQDPKTGAWFDNVLVGIAVTTTPFFGQDVQVFSAKQNKAFGTKTIEDENFDSPTRHQVHVETTQGGNMDKSKMSDAQKKQMKEMMDAGASEADALKKLQDAEDKKDQGADEGTEQAAARAKAESFTEMKATIDLMTAKLADSEAKHEALVHQFAAERQLRRTVEFVEAAEQFSALPAKQDELGMHMLWMYDADTSDKKENYGYFEGLFKQLNEVSKNSRLFEPTGSERFDGEGQDPFLAEVEKVRIDLFRAEPYAEGYAKAYIKVGNERQDLARQYSDCNTHIDHK